MPDEIHVCPDDLDSLISIYGEEEAIPPVVLDEYRLTEKLFRRLGGTGAIGFHLLDVVRRAEIRDVTAGIASKKKAQKTRPEPVVQAVGEIVHDGDEPPEGGPADFDGLPEGTEVIVDDDKPAVFMKPFGPTQVEVRFPGEEKNRRVDRERVEIVGELVEA